MASRTTTFPDAPEIIVFRAVDAILREDPGLVAAGVRFRSWDGSASDGVTIGPGECPLIRISPEILAPDAMRTVTQNIANFGVKVELFVAGTYAEDIVNFWGAIREAMRRDKPFRGTTVRCFIQRQCPSATLSSVTAPGFGSWRGDKPPEFNLAGVGRIEVKILVPN